MLTEITSASLNGIIAQKVSVEINTNQSGEFKFVIVGLPDASVKESQDRVLSAITNLNFPKPFSRTTINLAPGDLKKEGPIYDLPIAIGVIFALLKLSTDKIDDYLIAGELALSGKTRPIKGTLSMATLAKKLGKKGIIIPSQNADEACLIEDLDVIAVSNLSEAVNFLRGNIEILPKEGSSFKEEAPLDKILDFSDVKGQYSVKRAVEIAVAGGHNILMIGSPGSGKSMISKRIATIMPEPTLEEYLEILSIQSAAGDTIYNGSRKYFQRPFRSPHHTISDVGLIGGGASPKPGEISLAHNGVLFLDELPEFKRSSLEVLRQPLEDGTVTISRARGKITLPCSFILVAAMNPCPCGYLGDPKANCTCSAYQIQKYRSRISGPMLDRIDIHIDVPSLSISDLRSSGNAESSAQIRDRISTCRAIEKARGVLSNAKMTPSQIKEFCSITKDQADILQKAMESLNLSARAYDKILKVSRTIADLEASKDIQTPHLLEAIGYRSLDRH